MSWEKIEFLLCRFVLVLVTFVVFAILAIFAVFATLVLVFGFDGAEEFVMKNEMKLSFQIEWMIVVKVMEEQLV